MGKEKKSEPVPNDPVRELYAAYRELEAVRKLLSENKGLEVLEEMEAKRQIDVHQRLIDFFLKKAPGVGKVTLKRYIIPGFQERLHAFSRNGFSLTLPDPLAADNSFTVNARLSDLRRPGTIGDSLEARDLVSPKGTPDSHEPQSEFIARTFDELDDSEAFRQRMLASNLDKDRRLLPFLKDLQETLIVGRLMALSQTEDVPGLKFRTKRNQRRIDIQATYNDLSFTQTFNAHMPRSPQEHKNILKNAGVNVL
jgi:hypothetical protein